MISSKKLIKMARKWQNLSTIKRKVIVQAKANGDHGDTESCSSLLADKGHFVVYSADQRRFMIPLLCLNSEMFRELLELSEEEFGLPRDRPLTLYCDAIILEYIVTLIQRGASKDVERSLLMSVAPSRCSFSSVFNEENTYQQLLVRSF